MISRHPPPLTLLLLLALGGCSVYDARYFYVPHPAQVDTLPAGVDDNEPVRALASVVGVRKADEKAGIPASVEVRLQVENDSPLEVELDPGGLALFGGDSVQFPAPIVDPVEPQVLEPGGQTSLTAYFPFPGGDRAVTDLRGLNFRWTYGLLDQQIRGSVTFTRRRYHYGYPHPYYGYPYAYRFGYGVRCW